MHCFDTSALVDYLHGEEAVGSFVRAHEREPLFAPSVALFEVFVGAARERGAGGVADARDDLDWLNELPLSVDAAAEAALVDAELRDEGAPIGAMDTLVAGVARNAGGTVVTCDGDFENVRDLDVQRLRAD